MIDEVAAVEAPALPPLSPVERRAFDYGALEEAMAHLDAVIRNSRQALRNISVGEPKIGSDSVPVQVG